jgi:protein O-GlcNAc transferase
MKYITFSLWGNKPLYCRGAIKNAELATQIYPDWICKFYCGESVDTSCVKELSQMENCEVNMMGEDGSWKSMFWRFSAADSDDVIISRDVDSRLNDRERVAVEEWLNSDKDFHIMRDHPWGHRHIILGGMWGARNGILRGVNKMIEGYHSHPDFIDDYMVDQNFLRDYIYPSVSTKSMVHDPFFDKTPFPTKRVGRQFVGQPFDENDNELDRSHGDSIIDSGIL